MSLGSKLGVGPHILTMNRRLSFPLSPRYPCSHGRRRGILAMLLVLAWSITMTSFLTTKAQADWYAGAYGGLVRPYAFSNATLSSATLGRGVSDAPIRDLELRDRVV